MRAPPLIGASSSLLLALPRDVLTLVLLSDVLSAGEIVTAVGMCCGELHALAASDELWQLLMQRRYRPVIEHAFDGLLPAPPLGFSWREHYFEFAHVWMLRAKEHGRCILRISGKIFDATDYVDDHPGLPEFLLSAAGTDATAVFGLAGHSSNAHLILRRFAVPSLDEFSPPPERSSASAHTGSAGGAGSQAAESEADDALIESAGAGSSVWASALRVVHTLARSKQGRRQLLSSVACVFHAAMVDMERLGRDPREGEAIQRYLPVAWRLSCVECGALARLLRQPADAPASAVVCGADAFAQLTYAR